MKSREEVEAIPDDDRRIKTAELCFPQFPVFWDEGDIRKADQGRPMIIW